MKKSVCLIIAVLFGIIAQSQNHMNKSKNVVFIHGAWSTGEVWSPFQSYFLSKGFDVNTPTLIGHSPNSKNELNGLSMENYVVQLRELIQQMNSKPVLVAHSMGSIIAQRLAMEGLASKLVLIAPPVNYGMMPPSQSIQTVKWVNGIDHLKENTGKPSFDIAVEGMLFNLSDKKQKEVYGNMVDESGLVLKEMIWIKNVFGYKPNKIKYSEIKIPVLIVSGGRDKASPVKIGEKLVKKYNGNAELKVFKENAHWMLEENNWREIALSIVNWIE